MVNLAKIWSEFVALSISNLAKFERICRVNLPFSMAFGSKNLLFFLLFFVNLVQAARQILQNTSGKFSPNLKLAWHKFSFHLAPNPLKFNTNNAAKRKFAHFITRQIYAKFNPKSAKRWVKKPFYFCYFCCLLASLARFCSANTALVLASILSILARF